MLLVCMSTPYPQDCFGGCTDPTQGFYGFIDEVGTAIYVGCAAFLLRERLYSPHRLPAVTVFCGVQGDIIIIHRDHTSLHCGAAVM